MFIQKIHKVSGVEEATSPFVPCGLEVAMSNIKLADIAKRTGYSINTVSHALRDMPDISEMTKKHILQVAEEMGYIENISASYLRSRKSRSIAIIAGDISNPHFAILAQEMIARLRTFRYSAFVLNTDENEEQEKKAIMMAIAQNVDGIIICPVQKSHENIDFITKVYKIPCVLIGRRFEDRNVSSVICDDVKGGYLAAEHLLRNHHRNVLFVNVPSYISSSRDREKGAKKAFEAYGMDPGLLKICQVSLLNNDKEITEILKKHSDVTGFLCFSDYIALHICHFLKSLGKKVPEDVSVVGFDDIVSKFYLPLMLTSVTSSKTKMSVNAVNMLMKLIDQSQTEPVQCVLDTKLVVRESTSCLDG